MRRVKRFSQFLNLTCSKPSSSQLYCTNFCIFKMLGQLSDLKHSIISDEWRGNHVDELCSACPHSSMWKRTI